MRSPLLLVALASAAQAQYYYTDTFATYNSSAWSYTTGGLAFGGSGLTGDGGFQFVAAMIALNNGGNYSRQEVKATFNGLPNGQFWVSRDLYLTTNSGLTDGYKVAIQAGGYTAYQISGGLDYVLSSNGFSQYGATNLNSQVTRVTLAKR